MPFAILKSKYEDERKRNALNEKKCFLVF